MISISIINYFWFIYINYISINNISRFSNNRFNYNFLFNFLFNFVFNFQGMRFTKPGQYSLDITLDRAIVARIPLQVLHMPAEGATPS